MKTKVCTKCKIEKSLDEFSPNKNHLDGKASSCRICHNLVGKKYYKNNPEKCKLIAKKYREQHQAEIKKYQREHKNQKQLYRLKHKEDNKKYDRKHYIKYKHTISIKAKLYREKHKNKLMLYEKNRREQRKIYNKNYRKINKEKINEYRRRYRLKKYKNNLNFKIIHNLRTRIWSTVKRNTKSASTVKLIGCSIEFLKQYLESKFQDCMTWDNYGRKDGIKCWEIDHIRPCASFDLSKSEEQRKCFNYKNLQPLWAKDNLIKSKKFNKEMKERIL